jgi:hypothetical protein
VARIHARNARVYMAIASGGTAEPIPFLNSFSISFATEKADVTAFGDNNKIYAAGLPDASGDMGGFYDDATAQTFTAAIDGLPRKAYFYASTLNNAQYWHGNILPDFNFNAGITDGAAITASWNASSAILKVG